MHKAYKNNFSSLIARIQSDNIKLFKVKSIKTMNAFYIIDNKIPCGEAHKALHHTESQRPA